MQHLPEEINRRCPAKVHLLTFFFIRVIRSADNDKPAQIVKIFELIFITKIFLNIYIYFVFRSTPHREKL